MAAAEGFVPLRCQDCYRFTGDISELTSLTAETEFIQSDREALNRLFSPIQVELRLAAITLRLVELEKQITQNLFYSVGCPGVDLSQYIGTGEPIQKVDCQSPLDASTEQ